jgi:hypothetical protein
VQATRLLALTLAIVLSPRLAMTDVVGQLGQARTGTGASVTRTVETHRAAAQVGTSARDSAKGTSGTPAAPSSTPKIKGRWGSLRRIPLLRRSRSKAWDTMTGQDETFPLTLPLISSFSNWSGASGLANR